MVHAKIGFILEGLEISSGDLMIVEIAFGIIIAAILVVALPDIFKGVARLAYWTLITTLSIGSIALILHFVQ